MGCSKLFEYDGYELTKNWYDMTVEENSVITACVFYVKNKSTIRVTAEKFLYSYTTLWRRMHNECAELSPDLYEDVKKQIKINKKRIGLREGKL